MSHRQVAARIKDIIGKWHVGNYARSELEDLCNELYKCGEASDCEPVPCESTPCPPDPCETKCSTLSFPGGIKVTIEIPCR